MIRRITKSELSLQKPVGMVEVSIGEILKNRGLSLSTAESCTGGSIAAHITSVSGSSAYFKGSIVAYSNDVKTSLLNVSEETLIKYGAVSEETVVEMVKGAMKTLKTDLAVSTSGIAGPGGGSIQKPVGTIWMAAGYGDNILIFVQEGDSGRLTNVENAVNNALSLLLKLLQ